MDKLRFTQYCNTHMRNLLYHSYEWPDLYWRRIIRLGRAWAKHGSSCDNPSVYKYGQADGSSVPSVLTWYPRWFVSQDGLSRFLVWMVDPSSYTQTDYQTSYSSLPKLVPDGWPASSTSSINRANIPLIIEAWPSFIQFITTVLMMVASDYFHFMIHLLVVEQCVLIIFVSDILNNNLLDSFCRFTIVRDIWIHLRSQADEFCDDLTSSFILEFTKAFLIC